MVLNDRKSCAFARIEPQLQSEGYIIQCVGQKKNMNRPMLATLVDDPFDDKVWVFETKWDGFRLITEKRGNTVRVWSRNGIDVTSRYAVLLPALQKIEGSCVIDGEICALDAQGRSRFQLLQNALNKEAKLLYVLFDALFVGGKDIREKPLLERKQILKALCRAIRFCATASTSRSWQAGVRQSTASARGGRDRQAGSGILLLGQANARVAEGQGRA